MNVSEFALAQSVIPIGGHLKHPQRILHLMEVIIDTNTVMNSVNKFVFEMNSLFDVNHTHRTQGEVDYEFISLVARGLKNVPSFIFTGHHIKNYQQRCRKLFLSLIRRRLYKSSRI